MALNWAGSMNPMAVDISLDCHVDAAGFDGQPGSVLSKKLNMMVSECNFREALTSAKWHTTQSEEYDKRASDAFVRFRYAYKEWYDADDEWKNKSLSDHMTRITILDTEHEDALRRRASQPPIVVWSPGRGHRVTSPGRTSAVAETRQRSRSRSPFACAGPRSRSGWFAPASDDVDAGDRSQAMISDKQRTMEDDAKLSKVAERVAKQFKRVMIEAQLDADAAFARWMVHYKEWSDADEAENGVVGDQVARQQAALVERHSSQSNPEGSLNEDAVP